MEETFDNTQRREAASQLTSRDQASLHLAIGHQADNQSGSNLPLAVSDINVDLNPMEGHVQDTHLVFRNIKTVGRAVTDFTDDDPGQSCALPWLDMYICTCIFNVYVYVPTF